ncbi:MAG: hypothetical protein IPM29_02315 [Planctomycetes bacterium]|nr:hypothetical protein [Planctomycetota bacterium]
MARGSRQPQDDALALRERLRLEGTFSVLGAGEPSRPGIEDEFVGGVVVGVRSVANRPTGRIALTCARICDVDSSRMLFAHLAVFLLRVAAGAEVTDPDVTELLR